MSPNPALLTWPAPVAAAGGELTFCAGYGLNQSTSSPTFTDVPFGPDVAGRTVLLVGFVWGSGATINGITVNAAAATMDATPTPNNSGAIVFAHATPTGATGSVVLGGNAVYARWGLGVWSFSGPVSFGSAASGTTSASVTGLPGGFVLAAQYGATLAENPSWTNATQRFSGVVQDARRFNGADSTAVGSVTVSTDYGGTFPSFAAAAYSPA